MKTSNTWNFRSIVGKIMLGFVLAAMIGSINVLPVFSKDDHKDAGKQAGKSMGKHDNGRYERRGAEYDRDAHGRRDYRPYGYAPPPVIYAPTPAPGIGFFFPPIFIHHR